MPRQSYGQRQHVNSCDESKISDDGKEIHLSQTQGNRVLGACHAITCLLNMGFGSVRVIRTLVGEMNSAIEEQKVSKGRAKPVYAQQSYFTCATNNCEGRPNAKARARLANDPAFISVCTDCYFKRTRTAAPIVMQVSSPTPKQNSKAGRETVKEARKETTRRGMAKLVNSRRWRRGM